MNSRSSRKAIIEAWFKRYPRSTIYGDIIFKAMDEADVFTDILKEANNDT
jgi:hypothetical protein